MASRRTLGHEGTDARTLSGCQERVCAFGTQPVSLPEATVEMLEVGYAGKRGRLVNDRIGPRGDDRPCNRDRVENVKHDGFGTEDAQLIGFGQRPCTANDVVASPDELGDEPRSDRASRPGDEHSHRTPSLRSSSGAQVPTRDRRHEQLR
jgi:hypothetical protein